MLRKLQYTSNKQTKKEKKKKQGNPAENIQQQEKYFFFQCSHKLFPLKHFLEFDARRKMFFFVCLFWVKKHRHLHTVLVLSLSLEMCEANGSDSSRHSLLVSFSI